MEDFENTFTYAALINAMEKYDSYDPELIRQMKEDWNNTMEKFMEDKHGNSKESDWFSENGQAEMERKIL